ncbi:hypothetical protein C6P45_004120 [Maudiozyma exigua]|uniref:Uncharacterized protein n=1 Tax=Maudiozyma exigua TaxID=34358 RepID=A0A9P6WEF8_MAUEX|nr:hypothetical protein C6P45_004120 [Kazachstania exigua]
MSNDPNRTVIMTVSSNIRRDIDSILIDSSSDSDYEIITPENDDNIVQENDENKDLIMFTTSRNVNPHNLLFAINKKAKLERICQYYDGDTVCNRKITFTSLINLQNHCATKCEKHIQTYHKNLDIDHQNFTEFLNLDEKPASQLLKKRKVQRREITDMIKDSSNSDDQIFEKMVQCFVSAGVSYSFFDNAFVRLALTSAWKGWKPSYHRKKAATIVKSKAMKYRELFEEAILKSKVNSRRKTEGSFVQHSFKRIINECLLNLIKNPPLYISVESDDWKGNNVLSYSAVIFNFYSLNGRKHNFLAGFEGVQGKTRVDHQLLLQKKVSEYNANELWVNTCTDNASNTLGSTSNISRDEYPLFSGHVGCLAHLINLISESMISRIVSMEFVDDSEILVDKEDDNDSQHNGNNRKITISDILKDPFDGKAPQILKKLIALNKEVRASDKKLKAFDAHVSKRIPKYCSVRWNIKLNILKTFVENFTGFSRFYQSCSMENIEIRNVISYDEKLQAEILIEMLQPYELLTRYVSEDTSLAIAYVPILISLKKHVEACIKKAEILSVNVCFDDTMKKIDKYIDQSVENYDILFSAGVLNLRRCDDIIDIYKTRKDDEFSYAEKYLKVAETIIKFVDLQVNNGEPTQTNNIEKDSTSFKRFLGKKKSLPNNIQIKESDLKEYLSDHLDGELSSLDGLNTQYWKELKKEKKLQLKFNTGNWLPEPTTDGITDEEYVTDMLYRKSDIEQLILESKVWVRIY